MLCLSCRERGISLNACIFLQRNHPSSSFIFTPCQKKLLLMYWSNPSNGSSIIPPPAESSSSHPPPLPSSSAIRPGMNSFITYGKTNSALALTSFISKNPSTIGLMTGSWPYSSSWSASNSNAKSSLASSTNPAKRSSLSPAPLAV